MPPPNVVIVERKVLLKQINATRKHFWGKGTSMSPGWYFLAYSDIKRDARETESRKVKLGCTAGLSQSLI
jgi:hypothetical protein